jgi:hypothetical protein
MEVTGCPPRVPISLGLPDSTALTCADPLVSYRGRAEPSGFDCVARAACESMAPAVVNTGL